MTRFLSNVYQCNLYSVSLTSKINSYLKNQYFLVGHTKKIVYVTINKLTKTPNHEKPTVFLLKWFYTRCRTFGNVDMATATPISYRPSPTTL